MKDKGFTLVELLVVIAIVLLVFGVSIASFNRFNRRERLHQAALNLKSMLRYAQTKAISAEKPTAGCTTFVGMRVSFTLQSYTVTHECTDGLVGTGETTALPAGVLFFAVPSPVTFHAITRVTGLSSDQTITFTNDIESYQITIAPNGDITDGGFQ